MYFLKWFFQDILCYTPSYINQKIKFIFLFTNLERYKSNKNTCSNNLS